MFYALFRSFILFSLNQYFHEVVTRGKKPVSEGPVLVVCNHPNVALDGLLVLRSFDRPINALAKGSLFRFAPRAWFFRWLKLVPVYQKADDPDASLSNEETFKEVFDRFDHGEPVLIFPEGRNSDGRSIFELKTGAARLALGYQEKHGFESPLVIQPFGLTYLDRKRFRGSVTVKIGAPIEIRKRRELYRDNSAEAVSELTEEIRSALQSLTVEIHDEDTRSIVDKIAKLYRSAGMGGDDLMRLRRITEMFEQHAESLPGRPEEIEKRLNYYLELSSALMLDGSSEIDTKERWLLSIILIPIVMFGLIVNYPPYRAVTELAAFFSEKYPGRRGSWGFGLGVCIFPLWFLFLSIGAAYLLGHFGYGFLMFGVLLLSGWLLNTQFQTVALFFFKNIWPAKRSPLAVLRKMRAELLEELEGVRDELSKLSSS